MPKPPAKAKLTARELLNRLKASGDWNDSQKGKVVSLMRTMLKKHERLSCFGSDVARALELTVEGEPPLSTRTQDWFTRTEGYRDDFGHSAEANEVIREAIQSLREQESFDDDSAKGLLHAISLSIEQDYNVITKDRRVESIGLYETSYVKMITDNQDLLNYTENLAQGRSRPLKSAPASSEFLPAASAGEGRRLESECEEFLDDEEAELETEDHADAQGEEQQVGFVPNRECQEMWIKVGGIMDKKRRKRRKKDHRPGKQPSSSEPGPGPKSLPAVFTSISASLTSMRQDPGQDTPGAPLFGKAYSSCDAGDGPTVLTHDEISALHAQPVRVIRQACKDFSVPASGSKDAMKERLIDEMQRIRSEKEVIEVQSDNDDDDDDEHSEWEPDDGHGPLNTRLHQTSIVSTRKAVAEVLESEGYRALGNEVKDLLLTLNKRFSILEEKVSELGATVENLAISTKFVSAISSQPAARENEAQLAAEGPGPICLSQESEPAAEKPVLVAEEKIRPHHDSRKDVLAGVTNVISERARQYCYQGDNGVTKAIAILRREAKQLQHKLTRTDEEQVQKIFPSQCTGIEDVLELLCDSYEEEAQEFLILMKDQDLPPRAKQTVNNYSLINEFVNGESGYYSKSKKLIEALEEVDASVLKASVQREVDRGLKEAADRVLMAETEVPGETAGAAAGKTVEVSGAAAGAAAVTADTEAGAAAAAAAAEPEAEA